MPALYIPSLWNYIVLLYIFWFQLLSGSWTEGSADSMSSGGANQDREPVQVRRQAHRRVQVH